MYIQIVIVSISLLFLQHAIRIAYIMGYHVTVHNHTPGRCSVVPGVDHGAEDMETLADGRAFITSGFQWPLSSKHFKQLYKDQGRKGKVLLFDFNKPESGVTELAMDPQFDGENFHPHGISVLQDPDSGKIFLFIVNHPEGKDTVEKFEFIQEKLALEHIETFSDSTFRVLNDVAATSENSFYVTNYVHSKSSSLSFIEIILLLPWGSVVYYDGANYNVVADSLVIPNGILLSKDKRYVYLANNFFASISIFERDEDDRLTILQEFPIHSYPDNLSLEPKTGNLLIGSIPVVYMMIKHMEAPDVDMAPSKVLYINMDNATTVGEITDLYTNDGRQISGCSSATIYDNKMLMGSVVDRLVYCDVRTWE
ncbi:serum paraoxonase/arylesterase 2-like isoform X1 [Mya arenaria]|uniref:serum paraoxonase/arylesterase 2-like isoform X1 n=2 Tax=Mya arenaria TaxID=6604 RepID=UPI0022E0A882|nr:serum paraoxonase/arylesterase 2-like isoform X1 [Mya arenaria]